jgi:hypothetical protein
LSRVVVGIVPSAEKERRSRLLAALEGAFPIRFEGRSPGEWRDLDAAVLFGSSESEHTTPPPCPCLLYPASQPILDEPSVTVVLSPSERLDRRLRGRSLREGRLRAAPLAARAGDVVLASWEETPLWLHRSGAQLEAAACELEDLGDEEVLRDLLKADRFLSLLPLVHFLKEVTTDIAWRRPALHAALIFDDPNLQWRSYGHVRFDELSRHAVEHGYHATMAMIPIDAFIHHPRTARLFRDNASVLSLVFHGNDHDREELMRSPASPEQIDAVVAQAIRRIEAFERRSGVRVDRVMCPPHGVCSERFMESMLRLGFEGLCADWPFPWPPGRPPPERTLAGWEGAQFLVGGFPVLPRYPLHFSWDDLVFRAFLDQPVIVYGHHDDLAGGLDRLAELATFVRGLGEAKWKSLQSIARGNFLVRNDGRVLRVRMLSRRISLTVPREAEETVIELPPSHSEGGGQFLVAAGHRTRVVLSTEETTSVSLGLPPGPCDISLKAGSPLDPYAVRRPRPRPWPIVRRMATQGRDRCLPLLPASRATELS